MKRHSKQRKPKWNRPSDADLDAMAERAVTDLQRANGDWNEGAKKLKELLETPATVDDIEDGENA